MMSGRLSLVYDKDFVAAKKKTKEYRERAQRASGGQYGSRIAQHISMVLLAQAANGVDGTTPDDGNHTTDYTDLLLGFLFLQFTFVLAYVLYKIVSYVTAATTTRTRSVRTTADATTQTTGRNQDTKLYHLNAMTRQYQNELDEYREYTAQLKAENTGLWRQLEDCQHECDALRRRPPPGVPQRVWLTQKVNASTQAKTVGTYEGPVLLQRRCAETAIADWAESRAQANVALTFLSFSFFPRVKTCQDLGVQWAGAPRCCAASSVPSVARLSEGRA